MLYGDFLLRARDGFLHGMIAGETRGIWPGPGLLYDDAMLMSLLPDTPHPAIPCCRCCCFAPIRVVNNRVVAVVVVVLLSSSLSLPPTRILRDPILGPSCVVMSEGEEEDRRGRTLAYSRNSFNRAPAWVRCTARGEPLVGCDIGVLGNEEIRSWGLLTSPANVVRDCCFKISGSCPFSFPSMIYAFGVIPMPIICGAAHTRASMCAYEPLALLEARPT